MSHVHFINGQLESADRYQAFLDQTRAVRLAEKKERTRKKAGTRSFETAIDADEETPEDSGGEPREETGQEPAQDPEKNPEADAGASEGFGQHYA
jgi:hypothetical protein